MPVRHISEETIETAVTIGDVVSAVARAYTLLREGRIQYAARSQFTSTKGTESIFELRMPASWNGHYHGEKRIREVRHDVNPSTSSREAIYDLTDMRNGRAVTLDFNYLTDLRTGAAAAHAYCLLTTEPPPRIGIIGTGRVARSIAMALEEILGPVSIIVFSRRSTSRQAFVQWAARNLRSRVDAADDAAACAQAVSVIFAAAASPTPILTASMVTETAVLSVIGGDSRTRQIERAAFAGFSVIVDDVTQAWESGEFLELRATGNEQAVSFARSASGDITTIAHYSANGQTPVTLPQRTMFYFTGIAPLDLMAAVTAWEAVQRRESESHHPQSEN